MATRTISYNLYWRGAELWLVTDGKQELIAAVVSVEDGRRWEIQHQRFLACSFDSEDIARKVLEAWAQERVRRAKSFNIISRTESENMQITEENATVYCR